MTAALHTRSPVLAIDEFLPDNPARCGFFGKTIFKLFDGSNLLDGVLRNQLSVIRNHDREDSAG
jgi:hypothetical protein